MATPAPNKTSTLAYKTLGWSGIVALALIVLGILGGPTFHPILDFIGLDLIGYRGIFIDCSLYENRKSDFCKPGGRRMTHGADTSSFRQIDKNSLPFNLHN